MSIQHHINQLKDMVDGKDLVKEWYKFISTGKETPLRTKLISFYKAVSKISYFKEAKFYEKFWKELLSSQFEFVGYCTLKDDWSETKADYSWGVGKESGLFQIVRKEAKEALPFTPIMRLDKKLSSILKDSRSFSDFESPDDEHYQRIKKTLPYPFNFFRENE